MQMDSIHAPTHVNSQERAYLFLKQQILNLELKPNQKLAAQEIAAKLDVSRTPVREAFSRLEQEGFLVRQGGWGYAVRIVTFKDAVNIFRMRETLEVEAIKEVMPKINSELLVHLETCLVRAEEKLRAGKVGEYRTSTRAFYRSIAQATDNNILEYMFVLIDDRVRWIGATITNKNFDRPRQSLAENKKVLQALRSRDEDAAVAGVRKHVSGARESFFRFVAQKPDPFQL
jgi:DNA-binding GntR family transcriptional regulator